MRRFKKIVLLLVAVSLAKTSTADAQRLDDIVDIIAFAWSHSDAKTLVAMAASEGISIETNDGRMGPLGPRQASAVLRRIFEERQTLTVRQGITQAAGGEPRRAFSEITWTTRAPDTTQPERLRVFLELVLEGDRWRITQIRMLP